MGAPRATLLGAQPHTYLCFRRNQPQRFRGATRQSRARAGPQQRSDEQQQAKAQAPLHRQVLSGAAAAALAATLVASPVGRAWAADTAKVGTCLLESCQLALATCLADGNCLQDLVCLNSCNGRPDETECQIKCGDLYEDKAVQTFNACAVSEKKCVPQRVDKDKYPVPPDCARDKNFDLNMFTGRWYITAGLNQLFDVFPCQEHFFGVPEPGLLYAKINWRVPKPDGDFLQRSVVQTFRQQPEPDMLWNHGNSYLHYEDDWYVLASKPDEYVLIYYIGNNDAWKGYGGAVLYTREAKFPEKYAPELREAASRAGISWDDFQLTDNSCPAKPPMKTLAQIFTDDITEAERDVGQLVTSFGKGFTILEQEIAKDLTGEEQEIARELEDAEKYLASVEQQYETGLRGLWPFKWFLGNRTG
jgi:violaxanthin de-epoxidase